MTAPAYSANDFARALQALMPMGKVWPRDADSLQSQVISGLAAIYKRSSDRAQNLISDAFPASTVELLPEWESALGLPDPCAGDSPTIQQRRSQVVARFANSGGQSSAFFVEFANNLGFDVSIDQFAPFRAGQSRAGDPVYSADWAFAWRVDAPPVTVEYFRAGISAAGEALAEWGNAVLLCEMSALKPAHTTVIVANPGFINQSFRLDTSTLS
ncbi:YmfQ family protein [Burkholderia anthina]|uniref:YmfQ family protein n=1 Tax=Burkholderia anthina TaxID=179879 RepID=UPI00158F168E|nr:putative phage tail protein [Burkholderia anthina]